MRGVARERRDERLSLAWTIARLNGVQKLPPLDKLLARQDMLRPQTPERIASTLDAVVLRTGGALH